MKHKFIFLTLVFTVTLTLFVSGCAGAPSASGGFSREGPASSGSSRSMVPVAGTRIIGSGPFGAFPAGRAVTLSAYRIAKYETTWELWNEVYMWALENGYRFANPGWQGHEPEGVTPGTGTTNEANGWTATQKSSRPVTCVTWRDAIVWCNAYSEKSGLEPVYTGNGSVLKDSNDAEVCDHAVMDRAKNGYRLPTMAEWELAARGGTQRDQAWTATYSGGWSMGEVGWFDGNTKKLGESHKDFGVHPVGTKPGNLLGVFDMTGNVWEWCWDWAATPIETGSATDPGGPATGVDRVIRTGSWEDEDIWAIVHYGSAKPDSVERRFGFRVVCQ